MVISNIRIVTCHNPVECDIIFNDNTWYIMALCLVRKDTIIL